MIQVGLSIDIFCLCVGVGEHWCHLAVVLYTNRDHLHRERVLRWLLLDHDEFMGINRYRAAVQ